MSVPIQANKDNDLKYRTGLLTPEEEQRRKKEQEERMKQMTESANGGEKLELFTE